MSAFNPVPLPDPEPDPDPASLSTPGLWIPQGPPPSSGPQIGPPPVGFPNSEGTELPDIDEGGEPDSWPKPPEPEPDLEIDEQEQTPDTFVAEQNSGDSQESSGSTTEPGDASGSDMGGGDGGGSDAGGGDAGGGDGGGGDGGGGDGGGGDGD